ncbi:phosphoribosylglycinamide formyltransferase [Ignavibacterium sp.]|uniref:phosphoribosylglycinamide formyltransferase n=1 Tax=Ignavibacterium sp. TaxID=2651167 RepID=UPI00307ED777
MLRLAVFVSGRGSNLKAILEHPELKNLIEIVAVFSDKSDCGAFQIARSYGIETRVLGKGEGRISNENLLETLKNYKLNLIVLAGYLKLVPVEVVREFENLIINIHPALLPSFGGKGMYGINVHTAVFNSSAKVSGATVHFVDAEYDKGKIIAQKCVDISDAKSPEEIAERVLRVEHQLLPEVIKAFAENRIFVENNRAIIKS